MDTKAVVSVKGQVVIPKPIREELGLHFGSELMIYLRQDHVLELKPVKRHLEDFFGMGAQKMKNCHPVDVDEAIAEAILDNDHIPGK